MQWSARFDDDNYPLVFLRRELLYNTYFASYIYAHKNNKEGLYAALMIIFNDHPSFQTNGRSVHSFMGFSSNMITYVTFLEWIWCVCVDGRLFFFVMMMMMMDEVRVRYIIHIMCCINVERCTLRSTLQKRAFILSFDLYHQQHKGIFTRFSYVHTYIIMCTFTSSEINSTIL